LEKNNAKKLEEKYYTIFIKSNNIIIGIFLSDSLIAISTLLIAVLFLLGYDTIWMLFAVSAIRALGQGIQTPAVSAILPQIVPEDKLTKVNATNQSIQSLVMLVSPMISGALLSLAPLEYIFFIDVITAAIAVVILVTFLKVPSHAKALQTEKVSYSKDLIDGIRYIRKHKFIKRFFLFCGLFFILAGPVAFLTPLQVTRSFGEDVWRLTAIEITFSIGMMIGGLFMAFWGGFKNRVHTIALSSFLMSACIMVLLCFYLIASKELIEAGKPTISSEMK